MPAPKDLVHETTTVTGASNASLSRVYGRQRFSDGFATGGSNAFYYGIAHRTAYEWEVGTGSLQSGALSRDTVLRSSNSNSAVSFSAGVKDVTNGMPADFQFQNIPVGTDGVYPETTGAGTLGKPTNRFTHLYLASEGGQVNLGADAILSRATDGIVAITATFKDIVTGTDGAYPATTAIGGLGKPSQRYANLYLASEGGQVNWGDANIARATDGILSITGALQSLSIASEGGTLTIGDVAFARATDGVIGITGTFKGLAVATDGVTFSGDVTSKIDQPAGKLRLTGATGGYTVSALLAPATDDGAALGVSGTAFSDLFLASAAAINFNAGDITLTHSSNTLTMAGGVLALPDGTLSAPSLTNDGDVNTGFYFPAADVLAGVIGGNVGLYFGGSLNNIGLGFNASNTLTASGINNVSVGVSAGTSITSGSHNMSMGTQALTAVTTGDDNVSVGRSGFISLNGANQSQNVGIGGLTGSVLTSGSGNTLIGYAAGDNMTATCDQNILIGYLVDAPSSTGSNQISIGNLYFGDNTGTGTSPSVGKAGVGIGTSLDGKLHVDQFTATDGFAVVSMDQGDDSEEFVHFLGAASSSAADKSLIDATTDFTSAGTLTAWAKVSVTDAGSRIGGGSKTDFWMPLYTVPS